MTKILYLTDPGISAKYHIDLLGNFLAQHSRKHKPDFVAVGGDYIDIPELLEQKMFRILVEQRGMSKEEARLHIEAEKSKPGIKFFRPAHPPIPEPWFREDQMYDLYSDMVRVIEANTENAVLLNAGNHDLKVLQQATKDSISKRVFNPEFTIQEINGLYVGGLPGSSEGIRFLNEPNYTWNDSIGIHHQKLRNAMRVTRTDLLLTHMPPQIKDGEQVLGYGSDRIPDWDLFERQRVITTDGRHVGYTVIRQFVEMGNPPLVLSGHVEEARHLRDKTIHSGAVDKVGRSVVVNPGGFYPNWFEKEPVAVLVNYDGISVNSVSFIVGDEVTYSVNEFEGKQPQRRIRSIEDLL